VVIEELQRAGCEVVFLNHAYGESPEERMLLQMQGVFAEYERALIKERVRRGRLFAARQGRINWCNPPYGYRLIRKTEHTPQQLLVDETEAEVVRQLYRWLVEESLSSYTRTPSRPQPPPPPTSRSSDPRGPATSASSTTGASAKYCTHNVTSL
ncbi:MAG: recombinase family protein, partial [Chloroflexota bacterium]|nr:recombinase family protein [Chloroflexota bacterium]